MNLKVCVAFTLVLDVLRQCYLFLYNLLQFLGFSWTLSRLTADLILQGALNSAFGSCAAVLYSCQMLAALEVMNATLGLVKTPVFPTLIQVAGRNLILFVVFGSLPDMQGRSVVFCVFYLWSAMDMFRYLAHAVVSIGMERRTLTWLQNAVWVLLYPLTAVAEAAAVLQSLPVFDKSGLFSIPLPEAVGFSISFSFSLRLYLVLMLFGMINLFCHVKLDIIYLCENDQRQTGAI
uniref:Very-long-chain (3R)-3-hydroxyacyl-CoA dehydratase n=1 Tax=Electrophorus electricus TaxID=8005 RepID=A0A4W4DS07_ELEEL